MHGRDVDDPAELMPPHVRQRGLRAMENTVQVNVHDPVPFRFREIRDGRYVLDSCVVDQHVEARAAFLLELSSSFMDEPATVLRLAEVRIDVDTPDALRGTSIEHLSQRRCGVPKPVQHNIKSATGELFGDPKTDAASRSGYQSSLHGEQPFPNAPKTTGSICSGNQGQHEVDLYIKSFG
jgi:hypothetical protein